LSDEEGDRNTTTPRLARTDPIFLSSYLLRIAAQALMVNLLTRSLSAIPRSKDWPPHSKGQELTVRIGTET